MSINTVPVTDVSRHFSEYLNRVVYKNEHFILTRGKKPVAKLDPMPIGRTLGELAEMLNNLPKLKDSELKSLQKDILKSRKKLKLDKPPWDI